MNLREEKTYVDLHVDSLKEIVSWRNSEWN